MVGLPYYLIHLISFLFPLGVNHAIEQDGLVAVLTVRRL
jgi:hypothetical protein